MNRTVALVYGVLMYAMFLAVFLYLVGFLANAVVPKGIDSGPETPFATALLINLALLALFGVPHTVMARPAFKEWWTKFVPVPIERSTYVLISNLCVILLLWQWRPMPDSVWNLRMTGPVVTTCRQVNS